MQVGKSLPERRGGARNKELHHEVTESVVTFIKRFRVRDSHYSRSKCKRQFLGPDMNISTLFKMWKSEREGEHQTICSLQKFTKIFNSKFNLGFGHPQTDICSVCLDLSKKIREKEGDVHQLKIQRKLHLLRAKKFYELLTESRKRADTITCCFDMMQNQPLPRTNVTDAYYRRQLWFYTLGIIIHKKNQRKRLVHLYTWLESESGKGSNEVCSALASWLILLKKRVGGRGYRYLDLFADSAASQNKNTTMLAFLLSYVNSELNIFKRVRIIFPIRGHSYMPPDRVFGRIEKDIRKKSTIATPEEYCAILSKHGKVFRLQEKWHVRDYKKQAENLLKKSISIRTRDTRIWTFTKNKRTVHVSNTYSGAPEVHNIMKPKQNFTNLKPKVLPLVSHVSEEKVKDVRHLLSFIPLSEESRKFYDDTLQSSKKRKK